MAFYDGNGNLIEVPSGGGSSGSTDTSELSSSFKVERICLVEKPFSGASVLPYPGDGLYSANPWVTVKHPVTNGSRYINFQFLDANRKAIAITKKDGTTTTNIREMANYFLVAKGNVLYQYWIYAFEDYASGVWHENGTYYTLAETPAFISCSVSGDSTEYVSMAYNFMSDTEVIPWDARKVTVNTEKTHGLLEQVNDYVQEQTNTDILNSNEAGKIVRSTVVKEMNHTRDALRVATYNIYGAGMGQKNWQIVKGQLKDFGIDLCACQEVKYPLGDSGSALTEKVFATEMQSWQFPYCSTNGELYPVNERMLLSGLPIVSSYEWEFAKWSSDKRCCAKYEVQLPLYKDRVGSDQLKMSIYNTQLEVYPTASGNATNRIAETQEILDMIAADENPFIVVLMDSNDFSPDKEIWKMFTDAGFTYAIPIKTQTVTAQDNCIDQIFVNRNMEVLNYDVINSNLYPYKVDGTAKPVSDHDLCFADVRLKYDDFYCIKQTLTNVTSDCAKVIIDNDAALTINLTAAEGYTLGTVKVRMGHMDVTADVYADGVITIPAVTGDVYIIASGTAV